MASARYSEPRSSCSMARDFHEHSSTDASSARSLSARDLLSTRLSSSPPPRRSVHLSAAFSTCLAHPRLPRVFHAACISAGQRRNTSSVAEVPFNLSNSDEAPDSPWNVHLRYNVDSTAIRNREDTLVNPFELTPINMK